MIVWGGTTDHTFTNTGGIYDPETDTWTPTSTINAPTPRTDHTAVWTGSRMIVWGGLGPGPGYSVSLNTGGIYDPATDTWTAISTTNAPTIRRSHSAVWTGSKMIVFGGVDEFLTEIYRNDGGVYDPVSDTWTATSTHSVGRSSHTAVWNGSRMIVWGGYLGNFDVTDDGGIYDPATDTWTATSMVNAPTGRFRHTAVRMGSKMIVWGGKGAIQQTGAIYDPATDSWTATTTTNAPAPLPEHTAVWTGSKMIVWGGHGGIYLPPGPQGALVAGTERVFPLIPQCGIPDGAEPMSVNLAVTQPTAAGNLRLYPAGAPLSTVSSINYSIGQTRSNNAFVKLNGSGEVAVRLAPSGSAHFILDVNGYFDSSGSFFTLAPCRAVDTRNQ